MLGVYILIRFTTLGLPTGNLGKPLRKRFLGPLGLVADFVDATGGGGWGPVGTPAILANFSWVAAILLGGIIAAPIAAWLVRHIPPRLLAPGRLLPHDPPENAETVATDAGVRP